MEAQMEAVIPEWMSKADRNMLDIEGKTPIKWEMFCDRVSCNEDHTFAVLDQRRFEQCGVVPSPDNDAIVGSALEVNWKAELPDRDLKSGG
jgi:hypothetical protein